MIANDSYFPYFSVKSFVASTIINIYRSEAPYKMELKRKLSQLDLTQWLNMNITSSRESQILSSFAIDRTFGTELMSEIIYNTGNTVPSEMRTNLTIELLKQIINIGEAGIRMENLPSILQKFINRSPLLKDSKIGKLLTSFVEQLPKTSDPAQLEMFFKMFGKEMLYFSMTEQQINNDDIIKEALSKAEQMLRELLSTPILTYQNRYELQVSTINGVPLIVELDTTAIAKLNNKRLSRNTEVSPFVSGIINQFIGYKLIGFVGLEMTTKLDARADVEIEIRNSQPTSMVKLAFPKIDIGNFDFYNHASFQMYIPGEKTHTSSNSTVDSRSMKKSCSDERLNTVRVCYSYDTTDMSKETDFPLTKPTVVSLALMKNNRNMQAIVLTTRRTTALSYFKLEIPGTQNPKKVFIKLESTAKDNVQNIKINSEVLTKKYQTELVMRNSSNSEVSNYTATVYYGTQHLEKVIIHFNCFYILFLFFV